MMQDESSPSPTPRVGEGREGGAAAAARANAGDGPTGETARAPPGPPARTAGARGCGRDRHGAARVLILGGTAEAAALAAALAERPGVEPVTSLAGRTRAPARPPGELRIGGFHGAQGLAAYLEAERIAALVDATHPFAAAISANAATAGAATGVPLLRLERPPWTPGPGDAWHEVADMTGAAAALAGVGGRVFLSVGRQDLGPFAEIRDRRFLVRMIDPPEAPLPLADPEIVLGRGPFTEAAEIALLRRHRIAVLVAKNSGGAATYPKLAAARRLGLPCILVRRPRKPPVDTVTSVEAAQEWLEETLRRSG